MAYGIIMGQKTNAIFLSVLASHEANIQLYSGYLTELFPSDVNKGLKFHLS